MTLNDPPLTPISMARRYSTLNISETIREKHVVTTRVLPDYCVGRH